MDRTYEELKQEYAEELRARERRLDRTYEELKHVYVVQDSDYKFSLDRTYEELKLDQARNQIRIMGVFGSYL